MAVQPLINLMRDHLLKAHSASLLQAIAAVMCSKRRLCSLRLVDSARQGQCIRALRHIASQFLLRIFHGGSPKAEPFPLQAIDAAVECAWKGGKSSAQRPKQGIAQILP
jgi:hypothetical protein